MTRTLIVLHRWLGVALCSFFLLWFVSGIGLMYWPYPAVTHAERLERAAAIDATTVHLSPQEAAARAGLAMPAEIRLSSVAARAAYAFGFGDSEIRVFADTGERIERGDRAVMDAAAAAWTGRPVRDAHVAPLWEVDQWTIQIFRGQGPFLKYAWPNGEHVYVSQASGSVAQYTNTRTRLGAYLGPIPHWLYFTPLRKHGAIWSRVVIALASVGTVAALLGVVVGLLVYSPSRRYRFEGQARRIPYRGQKRWHTVFGLVFGTASVTWVFSGLLSMDPFPRPIHPGAGLADVGRLEQVLRRSAVPFESFAERNPRPTLEALSGSDVREMEWTSFGGEPFYLLRLAGGEVRIAPLDGPVQVAIGTARIEQTIREAARPGEIREIRMLDEYDRYYRDRHRLRPLPVLLVTLSDADSTRYYIDPSTAQVAAAYSSQQWIDRWAYQALHSIDFPWLYNHRPAWDIVVITLMAGGTALSVTSVILASRVITRNIRRPNS